MERDIDIMKVSDGKRYSGRDLARLGCRNCEGCHLCCTGMGTSIILDPYDAYMLVKGTGRDFASFIGKELELQVFQGVILPDIKEQGIEEGCSFLNEEGRCSIHGFRPGMCRLFPLGRIYKEDGFDYFLQIHECPAPGKTKVRISEWLGIENLAAYEKFVTDWHRLFTESSKLSETLSPDESRQLNMTMLTLFYFNKNLDNDFYESFYESFNTYMKLIGKDVVA